MKVEVTTRSDKEVENCDYRNAMIITIDGKKVFEVFDGEPEDASLSRDFNDAYNVPDIIKTAFNAGKDGESFELYTYKSDEI